MIQEGGLFSAQGTPPEYTSVLDEYARLPDLYSSKWKSMSDPIIQGFTDRHSRAMADLEGLGETQRADLNRMYDRSGSRARSDMTSRGLAGSTALQGVLRGNEAGRNLDRRRLEDQLTRERMDYDTRLSGDTLSAQSRFGVGGFEAGVRHPTDQYVRAKDRLVNQGISQQAAYDQNAIDMLTRMGMFGFNQDASLTGGNVGLSQGVQFQPGQGWIGQFGQGLQSQFAPQPESASPDYLGTFGSAGIGLAGSLGAASIIAGSDVEKKEDFEEVDGELVLEKVRRLKVQRWNYRGLPDRHIGPMAQDWHKHGFGADPKTIAYIDAIGVLLASVQELADRVDVLQKELESCRK